MLTEWDLLAIIIALGGAGVVIYYSIKENIALRKEIRRLQIALRVERKKSINKFLSKNKNCSQNFGAPFGRVVHRVIHN